MKARISLLAAMISLLSVEALACGDSLYRVGKGVSYRTYSAPLPGNLLVYGDSESARQLAEELARSGHGVHVAGSAAEFESELRNGQYDVVIAPFNQRSTIETMTGASSGSLTSFLPIAMDEEEEAQAVQSYGHAMVPDKHEIKHYLKAIHRTLKNNS